MPGHTPADVAYRIGDAVFVGDTIFMPDYGTARADFPGGDARARCTARSGGCCRCRRRRACSCATTTRRPAAIDYAWETTVAEERARNVHVHDGVAEAEFVAMRTKRDASLAAPSAAAALGAGEHPGRSPAAAGRQRPELPQDSGDARRGMTIGRAFRSR